MPGSQGPIGYRGSLETPATLRVGDLIESDGVYFPITDMVTGRNAAKILHFNNREPMLAEGTIYVYRQNEPATVIFGEIVYTRQ